MKDILLTAEDVAQGINGFSGWAHLDAIRLEKEFSFKNFKEALVFVNKIGELAEKANHHPDICFGWGKVVLSITTHSAGGVTEKDLNLLNQVEKLSLPTL